MRPLQRLSAQEQVAAHLEEELRRRTWTTVLPGAKHRQFTFARLSQ